jgi:hypothetical protein
MHYPVDRLDRTQSQVRAVTATTSHKKDGSKAWRPQEHKNEVNYHVINCVDTSKYQILSTDSRLGVVSWVISKPRNSILLISGLPGYALRGISDPNMQTGNSFCSMSKLNCFCVGLITPKRAILSLALINTKYSIILSWLNAPETLFK